MMTMTRRLGMAMLLAAAGSSLMGCSSSGRANPEETEGTKGQLALPLVTQGASGVVYRLRDATFNIYRYDYYMGAAGTATGGAGPGYQLITVSSETNPDAATISVALEEGQYFVTLQPGWHFEKQTSEGYETVDATLLSGETQWIWVSRRSTSFAEFQFGLGGREIWLNGELNIGVVLYEDPSELEGHGGYAGYAGAGGFVTAGTWSGGSAPIPVGGSAQ